MPSNQTLQLSKKLCADIKIARKRRGFSMREIASRLEISPTTYANFENHGTGSFALFCEVVDLLSLSNLFKDILDPYKDREATRRELIAIHKKQNRRGTTKSRQIDEKEQQKIDDLDF